MLADNEWGLRRKVLIAVVVAVAMEVEREWAGHLGVTPQSHAVIRSRIVS